MKHATLTARTAISDHDKKVIALVRVCIGFTNQPIQELAENYTISFIGSGCVSDFVVSQRAMDMPDELVSLQIATALSMGLKINSWRIKSSRYRPPVRQ